MNNTDKALIWFDSFDFISYNKKARIIEIFKNPCEICVKSKLIEKKSLLLKILKEEEFLTLVKEANEESVNKVLNSLENLKINAITKFSQEYPETLLNIDSPPFVIYYKGDISLMNSNCFSVVGSRTITNYGKVVTEKFVKGLVEVGFTIVSGLASGVDTVAHRTTLQNNGKTIAVLAGGLDEIYPVTNTMLAQEIVQSGGLLISETRPKKKAEAFMFPIRNRIIAGLSRAVIVTEARENSGSIHTKNYAIDYGRDVFAVPGSIFDASSYGTNKMIVDNEAKAVVSVDDILEEYSIRRFAVKPAKSNFTAEETIIIELLREKERSFQELVETSGLEVKKLNTLLTLLSIRGIIKKLAGNVYYLN